MQMIYKTNLNIMICSLTINIFINVIVGGSEAFCSYTGVQIPKANT